MTLPSITNATLTKVESAALSSDYDQGVSYGAVKFNGSQPVFLSVHEEQVRAFDPRNRQSTGESNILIHRSVVVSDEIAIDWAIDDHITIDSYGDVTSGTIRAIKQSRAPGFDGVVRIFLDDA